MTGFLRHLLRGVRRAGRVGRPDEIPDFGRGRHDHRRRGLSDRLRPNPVRRRDADVGRRRLHQQPVRRRLQRRHRRRGARSRLQYVPSTESSVSFQF